MPAAGSASDLLDDREFAVPRELVVEYLEHRSTRWPG